MQRRICEVPLQYALCVLVNLAHANHFHASTLKSQIKSTNARE
jgi:hypothetical protein